MISQRKTKVACVGDSVTFGYTIEDRENNSYPSQLQSLLGNSYEVGNFGKNGATLLSMGHRPYIQQDEYQKALEFSADIVVIHLGLNDTDPRNWVNYKDFFIQDYLNLIEKFKEKNRNARVFICKMTPITHNHPRFQSGTRDWYWQIQESIIKIAEIANVEIIDLQDLLYSRTYLLPDSLHPNEEGAKLIANAVYQAITGNYGGLKLPDVYSDNMVIQRDVPVVVRGGANADDEIEVSIERQKIKGKKIRKQEKIKSIRVKSDSQGKWEVSLGEFQAGTGYQLKITSKDKVVSFKNIAFGDVYLCSGQSNMAFPLKSEASFNEKQDYSNANIRIFNKLPKWETQAVEWNKNIADSLNNLAYYKESSWQLLSSENAKELSAVAYFFAKTISFSENVPVGLICNAVGGSNLESWIDRKTLEFHFPEILKNWTENDFIMDWARKRALQNINQMDKKTRHPYEPTYLFESGILPLKKYPIAGVLWYQGESNAHNIETFERLFPLFVKSWRDYWDNQQLPFYFVQLSSINRPTWGYFRDAQRLLNKQIPNTYMAISSDLGHPTDVHPTNKKPIGERLALWALHTKYAKKEVNPFSAECNYVKRQNEMVYVHFNNAISLQTSDGKSLQGFEAAEIDGFYHPADAKIVEGNKVQLTCEKIKKINFVRYNFAPFANGNLINEQKLPTSTFKAVVVD